MLNLFLFRAIPSKATKNLPFLCVADEKKNNSLLHRLNPNNAIATILAPSAKVSFAITDNDQLFIFNDERPMDQPWWVGTFIGSRLLSASKKVYW